MPDLLKPIDGLEFFEDIHRYRYKGNWIAHSCTGVIAGELDAKAKAHIERTKDGPNGWAIRGSTVHSCLEQHLLGEAKGNPGDFSDWVDPLLDCWLFKNCTPLAVEHRLVDPRKSLAGSFDFLVRTERGTVVLGDLKTVGTAPAAKSRKPAVQQLGCYLQMLCDWYPTVTVTKLVTVVAGPGVCDVKPTEPDEALGAWIDTWDSFRLLQPDF